MTIQSQKQAFLNGEGDAWFERNYQTDDLQSALKNFSDHLKVGGWLVFESRNPNLDWYEIWGTENLWTTEQGEVR